MYGRCRDCYRWPSLPHLDWRREARTTLCDGDLFRVPGNSERDLAYTHLSATLRANNGHSHIMTGNFQALVVGSGPAGIAAAVCAAEHGLSVGLVDDNPNPGGQIWRSKAETRNVADVRNISNESEWQKRLFAASITRLQGWSVFDNPSTSTLRAERRGEAADFRYKTLILATGA